MREGLHRDMFECSKGNTQNAKNELGPGLLCSLVVWVHAARARVCAWTLTAGCRVCRMKPGAGFLSSAATDSTWRAERETSRNREQCTLQLMENFVDFSGSWIWSCAYLNVLAFDTVPNGFFFHVSFLVFSSYCF